MGAAQAPDGLQPISVAGQLYYVDQDAIAGLKERGIQYDDGSQFNGSSTAGDFERGALHGATLGLADKKFGDSNQSVTQRLGGDDYAAVQQRSSIASGVGDFAGNTVVPVPGGTAEKGLAAVAQRVGMQAAAGAGTGAVRAYSEDKNPETAAGIGALLGGAGAGLVEGAGAALNAGSNLASKALNATADAARTRVFGIGGSDKQLDALAQRFGVDKLPEKLASMIESTVPPTGKMLGRNREQYRQELANVIDAKGPEIGALREQMGTDEGVDSLIPQEWSKMREILQKKLDSAPLRTEEQRSFANSLQKDIQAFDEAGTPEDLAKVASIKSEYQGAGHVGPMGTIPDNASRESAALLGRESKDTLGRLTDYALPESKAAHDAASQKFAEASLLADQISPKAIRDQLNTNAAGLSSMAAATLGGAISGGVSGYAADHPISGALGGAALGLGLAGTSGTRNFLSQVIAQPRGMDTLANIARAAGKNLKDLDLNELSRLVQASMGKLGGYAAQSD